MRSDGCFDSADRTSVEGIGTTGVAWRGSAAARNSATAGVDMRVALTYCLLKIPAKTGNPSSSLPSDSDEAVIALDIFVGGFKLWSAPRCAW